MPPPPALPAALLALAGGAAAQAECHGMVKGAIDLCAADCAACHIDTVRSRCPSRLAHPAT